MALTASQINYLLTLLKSNLEVLELKHKETLNKINEEFNGLKTSLPQSADDDVISKRNELIEKQDKIYKDAFNKLTKLYDAISTNGKKMANALCHIK